MPTEVVDTPAKYDFERCGYVFPPLLDEADDMMQAALLMYPFTKLRSLARSGALGSSNSISRILETPLPIRDVVNAIEGNAEALTEKVGNEDVDMCRAALKGLYERHEVSDEGVKTVLSFTATLMAYGDERSEEELVYGVGVDSAKKRITVAFRGSVTKTDFQTDACIGMVTRPNPLAGMPGQPDEIKIHSGFHEYLLKKNDNTGKSKYDEIMGHVLALFKGRSDHKLYSTGHSLGGALSILFAFEAASDSDLQIPSPVTCVSIASPKAGNESFRKANQLLEEQGRLRHLRVVNEGDPITLGPPASSKLMLLSMSPAALVATMMLSDKVHDEIYKHVGVKLKLYSAADDWTKDKKEAENGKVKSEEAKAKSNSSFFGSLFSTADAKGSGETEMSRAPDATADISSSLAAAFTSVFSSDNAGDQKDKGITETIHRFRSNKYKFSDSTGHWRQDFMNPAAAATVSHHYGFEYSHRMLGLRNELKGMELNDLYRNRSALGTSS